MMVSLYTLYTCISQARNPSDLPRCPAFLHTIQLPRTLVSPSACIVLRNQQRGEGSSRSAVGQPDLVLAIDLSVQSAREREATCLNSAKTQYNRDLFCHVVCKSFAGYPGDQLQQGLVYPGYDWKGKHAPYPSHLHPRFLHRGIDRLRPAPDGILARYNKSSVSVNGVLVVKVVELRQTPVRNIWGILG